MKEEDKQEWLTIELGDGWKAIVPELDIEPHGFMTISEKGDIELAGMDCVCKPKINSTSQLVIHNSFRDKKRIDEAMSAPLQ